MGHDWTNVTGAVAGDADGYKTSVNMANGAYALDLTAPTFGARHVTLVRTRDGAGGTEDTPGTVTLVGIGPNGPQTEIMIPGAHGVTVTSKYFYKSLTSATQAAWVVDAGLTADTIVIGWDNVNVVAVGQGTLHAVTINVAGASAIYVGDSRGKIATIPANQAAGSHFLYDINYSGYLEIVPAAAASDITVAHSGSLPTTYA